MPTDINLLIIKEEQKADGLHAFLEEAGDNDYPIFDLQPEFAFTETQDYSVLSSTFTSGMVMRRAVSDRKKRVFSLRWKNANESDKNRIVELYQNRRGAAGAMWYTPVDVGSQVKVRFKEDSLTWNKRKNDNYQIRFDFVELL